MKSFRNWLLAENFINSSYEALETLLPNQAQNYLGKILDPVAFKTIGRAFRSFSLKNHPDQNPTADKTQWNKASEAWEVLKTTYESQKPIDKAPISNHSQHRQPEVSLSQEALKQIGYVFKNLSQDQIEIKDQGDSLTMSFRIDSKQLPHYSEYLPSDNYFKPVFNISINANYSQFRVEVSLVNQAGGNVLDSRNFTGNTFYQMGGLFGALSGGGIWFDGLGLGIEGRIEEMIGNMSQQTIIQKMAVFLKKVGEKIQSNKTSLVWALEYRSNLTDILGGDSSQSFGDWPQVTIVDKNDPEQAKLLNHPNANEYLKQWDTFQPNQLILTIEMVGSKLRVTVSDQTLFKTSKEFDPMMFGEMMSEGTFLANIPRRVLIALKNLYAKKRMEWLKAYRGAVGLGGQPRGFWDKEQERYNQLGQDTAGFTVNSV